MIDAISDTLRVLYDTTESQFNLEVQLALKRGKNKQDLIKKLRTIRKKSDLLLAKVTKNAAKIGEFSEKNILKQNDKTSKLLFNSALKMYDKSKIKIRRLEKALPTKDAIFKQVQNGLDSDMKVRVNNKNYGYKEYMEMKTRTLIQRDIGDQQLDIGKDANVVFYLSNFFGDSADDHAEWQGKIFYDERYKTFNLNDEIKKEITKFIRAKKLKSVQWVRGAPVYLTTRPNCRHTINPISIQQAINVDPRVLLNALRLKKGSYRDKKYQLTQEQRYNERMIRKYKMRAESNEKLGYDATKDKQLVKRWQARQRRLLRNNPSLERDYRRETKKVILQDLGARYNL